jgi:hypothetical protein|nr:MAG TPA: hypothetical protein [Caudoviricetes sp.]
MSNLRVRQPGRIARKGRNKMITNQFGAIRHAMTKDELNRLYHLVEEFESDCTIGEHAYNSLYFAGIKTAIHQRLVNMAKEKRP